MARPSPNTVDYFPHYAKTGKTKTVLKQKFGHVGIACWWELLEILAKSENHFYDAENDLNWHYLLSVLDVSEDVANEFFDLLAILGNIDKDLWTSKKVIWCQNFCDNISYVYAKRRKETPSKPTFCDKNTTIRARNSNTDGVSVTEIRQREMEVEVEVEVEEKKDIVPNDPADQSKQPRILPYADRVDQYFSNGAIEKMMPAWKEAYPNVQIETEVKKAKAWLLSNTGRAKRDFTKFLNNWLSKAMEKSGSKSMSLNKESLLEKMQ